MATKTGRKRTQTAAQRRAAIANLAIARKKRSGARKENRSFGLTGRGGSKRTTTQRKYAVQDEAASAFKPSEGDKGNRYGRAKKAPAKSLALHAKKRAVAMSKSVAGKKRTAAKRAATRARRKKAS